MICTYLSMCCGFGRRNFRRCIHLNVVAVADTTGLTTLHCCAGFLTCYILKALRSRVSSVCSVRAEGGCRTTSPLRWATNDAHPTRPSWSCHCSRLLMTRARLPQHSRTSSQEMRSRGCVVFWLTRWQSSRRCASASPELSAMRRSVAQPGSASVWGTGGRGFESRRSDQPQRVQPGDMGGVLSLGIGGRRRVNTFRLRDQ